MTTMRLTLAVLFAITAATLSLPAQTWITSPVNGNRYALISSSTWQQAQTTARSWGGDLVTIRCQAEHDWLWSTFGPKTLWIGLTDEAVEGKFVWASGEPVTYRNWGPTEPNNGAGGLKEHYCNLLTTHGGRWNDANHTSAYEGIAERVVGAPSIRWTLDPSSQPGQTHPPGREPGQQVVFDEARSEWVLFGGEDLGKSDLGDTWTFDGTTWAQHLVTGPSARSNAGMAYDPLRREVVLYGGYNHNTKTNYNDTWIWDGQAKSWSQRPTASAPNANFAPGMVWDAKRGSVILFGGRIGYSGAVQDDTWEWDGRDWKQLSPAARPTPRTSAAMAYDPSRGQTLLFGGFDTNDLSDTWAYDGTTWARITPTVSPPARARSSMAWSSSVGGVVLFGGSSNFAVRDDVWVFDGQGWSQLQCSSQNAGGASPRYGAAVVANPTTDRILVVHGRTGSPPAYSDETWWLDITPAVQASFTPFGTGCAGTAGVPVLAPQGSSLPKVGTTFSTTVSPLGFTSTPFGLLGVSNTTWSGLSLPLDLTLIGMQGCSLYVSLNVSIPLPKIGSSASWDLRIPNMTNLLGQSLYQQAFVIDLNSAVSNAGTAAIGF